MFCGLPVMVAALPIFDAVATASRYGTGFRRNVSVISRTSGVSTRHIVSLTKKAENNPRHADYRDQQQDRAARMFHHALRHQAKKPESCRLATTIIIPNSKMMVSKLMALRFTQRERIRPDHQTGADNGRAGAVDAKAG